MAREPKAPEAPPATHVPLEGSERAVLPGARVAAEVDPNEIIEITIRVRPKRPIDDDAIAAAGAKPLEKRRYLSYDELVATHGADPAELERVAKFARDEGLEVVSTDAGKRTVVVRGKAAA